MKPPACSWRTVMVLMLLLCRSDSTRSMFSSPVYVCTQHFQSRPLCDTSSGVLNPALAFPQRLQQVNGLLPCIAK